MSTAESARTAGRGAFRATVDAAGFVLDVPVTGVPEAAGRVLTWWQDGAELRALPDGAWLLVLPEPVTVRADRAPGLPVLRADGALLALGTPAGPAPDSQVPAGHLVRTVGGRAVRHRTAELPRLDPAGWLDPRGLTVHHLGPVGTPAEPEVLQDGVPRPARPDLRAAAGVGPRSEAARRLLGMPGTDEDGPGSEGKTPGRRPWRARRRRRPSGRGSSVRPGLRRPRVIPAVISSVLAVAAAVVVLLGALVLLGRAVRDHAPEGSTGWRPLLAVAVAAGLAWALGPRLLGALPAAGAGAGTGSGSGAGAGAESAAGDAGASKPSRPRRRPLRGLLARFALRTPAAHLVRGRHARYLQRLTRAFEQRRWEDALRDAIHLADGSGGDRPGWLDLGLPPRHTGALRPTPRPSVPGGASVLSGPTVHQHLTELYRRAAEALEREGRIEEAAFVLADLLTAPDEAVALLDRHGRTTQAAELAEGRDLPADLVVRLWWRAGDRTRAVETAHRRAAFAPAVERLTATDPAAARDLRLAWADHRRQAGDRLGAVEAVWPDETLRPTVAADLRDAVALGGPDRGRALAHLLALGAGDATRNLALAILDGAADAGAVAGSGVAGGRSALVAALAELPGADRATDRELDTAAARAAVRDRGFGDSVGSAVGRRLFDQLVGRADPLVAADLARPRRATAATGARAADAAAPARSEIVAADRPGTLPVLDAALLASGSLLIACGQAGVRLLTPDGRTRARWDVPADRLVLADHGGCALLVADYGSVQEVSRLDLATRAVRRWATLRTRQIVPSFDGRLLITQDEDGIAVLDTLADRPTVTWREPGGAHTPGGQRVLGGVSRTPSRCSAVVVTGTHVGTPLVERWRWDLPGWELRSRLPLGREEIEGADGTVDPFSTLAGGQLLATTRKPAPEGGQGRTALRFIGEYTPDELFAGAALTSPLVDGDHWALTTPLAAPADTDLRLHAGRGAKAPSFTAVFPAAGAPGAPAAGLTPVHLRRHADAVTYWHRSGRVLATSPDGATLLANLRITADR